MDYRQAYTIGAFFASNIEDVDFGVADSLLVEVNFSPVSGKALEPFKEKIFANEDGHVVLEDFDDMLMDIIEVPTKVSFQDASEDDFFWVFPSKRHLKDAFAPVDFFDWNETHFLVPSNRLIVKDDTPISLSYISSVIPESIAVSVNIGYFLNKKYMTCGTVLTHVCSTAMPMMDTFTLSSLASIMTALEKEYDAIAGGSISIGDRVQYLNIETEDCVEISFLNSFLCNTYMVLGGKITSAPKYDFTSATIHGKIRNIESKDTEEITFETAPLHMDQELLLGDMYLSTDIFVDNDQVTITDADLKTSNDNVELISSKFTYVRTKRKSSLLSLPAAKAIVFDESFDTSFG